MEYRWIIRFVDTRVTITRIVWILYYKKPRTLEERYVRLARSKRNNIQRCFRRDNVIEIVHICKSLASIACLLRKQSGSRFPVCNDCANKERERGGGEEGKKRRKLPQRASSLPRCMEHEDSHRLYVDALPFHFSRK